MAIDVSSVHQRSHLPQFTMAGIQKRMEIGAIVRGRTAGYAGVHKCDGRSCWYVSDYDGCASIDEAALTPGAISIRNTWEIVSEKMIRQLSANARWDPLSRPGSPAPQPANQGELFDINSIAFPAQTNNDISNSVFSNNGNEFSAFAENPFDPFFLQPLGEMSNEDWTRAIAAVFEPAPNQVDLPFQ